MYANDNPLIATDPNGEVVVLPPWVGAFALGWLHGSAEEVLKESAGQIAKDLGFSENVSEGLVNLPFGIKSVRDNVERASD